MTLITQIHCPKCKRHMKVTANLELNLRIKDEDESGLWPTLETSELRDYFICPKCGEPISYYGTAKVEKLQLTKTKIPGHNEKQP